MVAIVGIIIRCGLTIEVCHRNQPNKSKLVLCNYKDGCGICGHTRIETFKTRVGSG